MIFKKRSKVEALVNVHPPGGVLRISSDRDDRMGPKIKTPKNPSIIPAT